MNKRKSKFLSLGLTIIMIIVILVPNFTLGSMNWSGPNFVDFNTEINEDFLIKRIIKSKINDSIYFASAFDSSFDTYMIGTSSDLEEWNFKPISEFFGQTTIIIDFTLLSNGSIFLVYNNPDLEEICYCLSNDNGVSWSEKQIIEDSQLYEDNVEIFSEYYIPFEYNNEIFVSKSIFYSIFDNNYTRMIGKLNQTSKQFDYITSIELPIRHNRGHALIDDNLFTLYERTTGFNENINSSMILLIYDFLYNTWTEFTINSIFDEFSSYYLYKANHELNIVSHSSNGIFTAKLIQDKAKNRWIIQKIEKITSSFVYYIIPVENSDRRIIFNKMSYLNSNYSYYTNEFNSISFIYYLTFSLVLIAIIVLPEGLIAKMIKKNDQGYIESNQEEIT